MNIVNEETDRKKSKIKVGRVGVAINENIKFIKEYNSLDNILKDMYPEEVQSMLGVTRYLHDMESKEYEGRLKVTSWVYDYQKLKNYRNARNEAFHGNMLDSSIFDDADVSWIINFKDRVLSGTDPIAVLNKSYEKKRYTQPIRHYQPSRQRPMTSISPSRQQSMTPTNPYELKRLSSDGCLKWIILAIFAFCILGLLMILKIYL